MKKGTIIHNGSLDKRVASFLLEETSIEGTNELKITHETIANHLGSHREVITRMLRYFQEEGLVKLSRSKVTILDIKRLEVLQTLFYISFQNFLESQCCYRTRSF